MRDIEGNLVSRALRRSPLFRAAEEADLARCVRALRQRRFRRGESVFHAGDPGDTLHVVVEGSVLVELPSRDGGEPVVLATLRVGDFFGELALLDAAPRSATIVALEPTTTLALSRDVFLALVDESATLRRSLLEALAREIRRLTGHVEELHFLGLGARLAARLADEVDTVRASAAATDGSGQQAAEAGALRLPWPYTQAELAGMIGGTRESVNRLLGDLAHRGLIRLERDALVVVDEPGLRAEAAG